MIIFFLQIHFNFSFWLKTNDLNLLRFEYKFKKMWKK